MRLVLTGLLLLVVLQPTAGQVRTEKPEFDQLTLQNGTRLEGIIRQETPQQIQFQYLVRKPGVRSLVFTVPLERGEIASLVKASESGRTHALKYLDELAAGKSREEEKARKLALTRVPWVEGQASSWSYQGRYFHLHSNAQEDLVRTVCFRLEDMFAAYVHTLGKRQEAAQPTRVLLFRSLEEYQKWLQPRGIKILNPAVYDPQRHEILAGSDLQRWEQELSTLRQKHDDQLQALAQQRQKLLQHFNGQPPPNQLKQLQQVSRQLQNLNQENEVILAQLQDGFFATLYHEAFHAYLDNWVYPSAQYDVPRWLNEGLAQLFENAFVEIGELRVGRVQEKRLLDIQDQIRRGRFPSLGEILQSPPQQFFVVHTLDAIDADRHYQAAWALTYYLTFELKLLNTEQLTKYVTREPRRDAVKAFEKLTAMPLDACELAWRQYLLRLRPDGTLRPGSERPIGAGNGQGGQM